MAVPMGRPNFGQPVKNVRFCHCDVAAVSGFAALRMRSLRLPVGRLAPVAISQNCFKISINFRRIRSISHELSTADFTLRPEGIIPPESLRFQTKSPPFIRRALVRVMRLERTRRLSHAPQTCLSTYSSTLAFAICSAIIRRIFVFVNTFFRSCSFFPGLVQ